MNLSVGENRGSKTVGGRKVVSVSTAEGASRRQEQQPQLGKLTCLYTSTIEEGSN